MSRCLRYRNAVICDHIAAQYVAGAMSPRVRSRTQTLIKTTPELDRAIARYADDFSVIHQRLPEPTFESSRHNAIWDSIDKATADQTTAISPKESSAGFWDALLVWKVTTGMGALASLVLAFMLFVAVPEPTQIGPSYLANMSAHNDPQNTIQFVISAYGANQGNPSRLHVQWSQEFADKKVPDFHVWAEDKDTGELSYIGSKPPKGTNWDMTKPIWKKVANSSRLLVTADDQRPTAQNTLFSGICLQLKSWKPKQA